MARMWTTIVGKLDFGTPAGGKGQRYRGALRLAVPNTGPALRGPDKYRILDLRRRRAQIRARRALQLVNW